MISIEINGQALDLQQNFNIRWERNSSLFENENTRGEFSYPIQLPLTENNKRILNNIHELSYSGTEVKFSCRIIGTGLTRTGILYIDEVDYNTTTRSGTVSCTVVSEEGIFYSIVKDKLMKDLSYGGAIPVPEYENPAPLLPWSNVICFANDITNGIITDMPFTFPMVRWDNFSDGKRIEDALAQDCINHWWPANDVITPAEYPRWIYSQKEGGIFYNRMVPMFKLRWILEQLFSEVGYTVTCDLFGDVDFEKLIVVSNYSVNVWSAPTVGAVDLCTEINPVNHMPDVLITDFLNEIAKVFGWVYQFTSNTVNIRLKKNICNTAASDFKHAVNPYYKKNFTDIPEIALGINFNYAPSDSDQAFNAKGNGPIERSFITGEVATFSDLAGIALPNENDTMYVADENKYYQYNGEEWIFITGNYIDYIANDNAHSLTCAAVPVPDALTLVGNNWDGISIIFAYFYYQLPQMDMQGTYFGDNNALAVNTDPMGKRMRSGKMGIHIMFYHGIQVIADPNLFALPYPFASSYNYGPDPDREQLGYWHLGWDKAEGLVETFYKDWLYQLSNTRKVVMDAYCSESQVEAIKLDEPYNIRNQHYWVYKVTYEHPHKGVVNIEAYKRT